MLIASPTGTGKTFAAFLAVLDALECKKQTLGSAIHCLYISPLRALAYDLEKNLADPLREIFGSLDASPIRVGMRTGDTSGAVRAKQFTRPPHILLTTPESLCVLLSQPRWLPHLASVRWVIVDEIHALAENKRGVHLSVSLARLAELRATFPGRGGVPPEQSFPKTPTPAEAPPAQSSQRRDASARGRDAHPTRENRLQLVGLSATVAPLNEVGKFLTGTNGACELVDVSSAKKIDLRVHTPLRRDPYPQAGFMGQRMIRDLGDLIQKNRTTLVFTNTRSGAEAATYWLRETLPELASVIECHHASLNRDVRQETEDRLKRGELRAVVCSTSLELGIDIGSVDLVVMLATPKGVSKALQRTGRAGHNIHTVSRGLLMATNVNDLVECCATMLLARGRHLDPVRIPSAPLDILAQHLVSMGCERRWDRDEAFALVREAWPYRDLEKQEFDDVLDYLAGGGKSLRQQYADTFGKIDLDDESFQTKPGRTQRDFLQNVGVIPETGAVNVRLNNRSLGSVEEMFIRQMQPGDVFVVAGRPVELEKVGQMEAWVKRADGRLPTIPRWNANKMPLSNMVAREIAEFRREVREKLAGQLERSGESRAVGRPHSSPKARPWMECNRGLSTPHRSAQDDRGTPLNAVADWIATRLDCGKANAGIIARMFAAQEKVSEIPTDEFLLIEELIEPEAPEPARKKATRSFREPRPRHYFFHSLIGRAANDALTRVLAVRLNKLRGGGGNALATPHDYGFVLTVGEHQGFTAGDLPELLAPDGFLGEFERALAGSEMLKYHFRNAAQTGLMVYRNYFAQRKPLRKLQWSTEVIFNVLRQYEPDHVLLREARRETTHTYLDAEAAALYLQKIAEKNLPVRLRPVPRVPPLSFAMYATKIREALMVEDPAETMERLFRLWWSEIETMPDGETAAAGR